MKVRSKTYNSFIKSPLAIGSLFLTLLIFSASPGLTISELPESVGNKEIL